MQGANVSEFLAASTVETGRLQIMQTLVGHSEPSGQAMTPGGGHSIAPPMFSVYRRDNNSSGTLSAARPSPPPGGEGAPAAGGSTLPPIADGNDRHHPSPARSNSGLSSIGAAVHRIPRQESFRVLTAGEELVNSLDEVRQSAVECRGCGLLAMRREVGEQLCHHSLNAAPLLS